LELNQIFSDCRIAIYVAASAKTIVNVDCPSFHPSEFCKLILKSRNLLLHLGVVLRIGKPHSNSAQTLTLLRVRHQWPRCYTAEQADELPPPHSITSSAIASSDGGTVRLSIVAV
jgi:hypothetical protein